MATINVHVSVEGGSTVSLALPSSATLGELMQQAGLVGDLHIKGKGSAKARGAAGSTSGARNASAHLSTARHNKVYV